MKHSRRTTYAFRYARVSGTCNNQSNKSQIQQKHFNCKEVKRCAPNHCNVKCVFVNNNGIGESMKRWHWNAGVNWSSKTWAATQSQKPDSCRWTRRCCCCRERACVRARQLPEAPSNGWIVCSSLGSTVRRQSVNGQRMCKANEKSEGCGNTYERPPGVVLFVILTNYLRALPYLHYGFDRNSLYYRLSISGDGAGALARAVAAFNAY